MRVDPEKYQIFPVMSSVNDVSRWLERQFPDERFTTLRHVRRGTFVICRIQPNEEIEQLCAVDVPEGSPAVPFIAEQARKAKRRFFSSQRSKREMIATFREQESRQLQMEREVYEEAEALRDFKGSRQVSFAGGEDNK